MRNDEAKKSGNLVIWKSGNFPVRIPASTLPDFQITRLPNRAFTLIEALTAITIIVIVLPTIMYGLSLTSRAASLSRHRTQATTLAKTKLDELLVDFTLNAGQLPATSGDFSDMGLPDYHWTASEPNYPSVTADGFTSALVELDVTVSWQEPNQPRDVTLSTLIYQNASATSGLGGMLP